jgi:hypothetical protein
MDRSVRRAARSDELGLRLSCYALAGDYHVAEFYWALPILLAETAFWIRLVIWVWPVPALAKPVFSDWILVVLILLLGVGITLYGFAALQPAPWNACLK